MAKKSTKDIKQERIVWDNGDHQIIKVIYTDDSYRLRVDVRGELSNGTKKTVIQEFLDDYESHVVEQQLRFIQMADKDVAWHINRVIKKRSGEAVPV